MQSVKENKDLILNPAQYGVGESKAEQIEKVFAPMVEMLKKMEAEFAAVMELANGKIDKSVCKKARELRLKIKKVRTTTENVRKEQKEEIVRAGKAIDGAANVLKYATKDKEEALEKVEKHFENLERERIEKLQTERIALLMEFDFDGSQMQLGTMAEPAFDQLLSNTKAGYEAKLKAEKEAEEKRLAEEAARIAEEKRIREENERLKKEAEEARKKAEAEEAARIEAERKQQEAIEAERKKQEEERKRIEAENQKRLEAERIAREAAEAERRKLEAERAAKEAEEKARIEAEEKRKQEAERKLKEGSDKEKITAYVSQALNQISIPDLDSDKGKKVMGKIQDHIEEIKRLSQSL